MFLTVILIALFVVDATNIASVSVAAIAAAAAYASQRAASRASTTNTTSTNEAKRLEQAYERARKFDLETIDEMKQKINEMRTEFQEREDELLAQIAGLKRRIRSLEETQS